ncbi:hypothetical protein [Nannocystis sp.]|uniref:hypothetical protein n=1 Tax=Nannocystis sp. TaxID=1962667 RepID=UPI00344EF629
MRFQGSKLGQWLDNLSDDLLDVAFVIGAGVAAGAPGARWRWWRAACGCSVRRSCTTRSTAAPAAATRAASASGFSATRSRSRRCSG